ESLAFAFAISKYVVLHRSIAPDLQQAHHWQLNNLSKRLGFLAMRYPHPCVHQKQCREQTSRISQERCNSTPPEHLPNPIRCTNMTFGTQAQGNNAVLDKLLDLEQLNVENQLRVGRDAREALLAICEAGRDGDTPFATDGHARDADIPTLDNF